MTLTKAMKPEDLVIVFTASDGYKVAMAYSDAIGRKGVYCLQR